MPDAATAGCSAEAVRGQSLSGVDSIGLMVATVREYTFRVWSVFRKLHAQLEVCRVVRVLLEVGSVRARLL